VLAPTKLRVYENNCRERESVLGLAHPQVAVALENWGLLASRKNYDTAQRLMARALNIRLLHTKAHLSESVQQLIDVIDAGPSSQEFAEWRAVHLPNDATLPQYEIQSLELNIASGLYNLGCLNQTYGHFKVCWRESTPERDSTTIALVDSLVGLLVGWLQQSVAYLNNAVQLKTSLLGSKHPSLVQDLHQLAWCYKDMHELETAERTFFQCLELMDAAESTRQLIESLGESTVATREPISTTRSSQKIQRQQPHSALTTSQLVQARNTMRLSQEPLLSEVLVELGRVYLHHGRVRLAFALQRQALFVATKALGDRHSRVGTILNNLAISYLLRGQYVNDTVSRRDSNQIVDAVLLVAHL
jgi:tetratricopeptide (TPR) repeat protein